MYSSSSILITRLSWVSCVCAWVWRCPYVSEKANDAHSPLQALVIPWQKCTCVKSELSNDRVNSSAARSFKVYWLQGFFFERPKSDFIWLPVSVWLNVFVQFTVQGSPKVSVFFQVVSNVINWLFSDWHWDNDGTSEIVIIFWGKKFEASHRTRQKQASHLQLEEIILAEMTAEGDFNQPWKGS